MLTLEHLVRFVNAYWLLSSSQGYSLISNLSHLYPFVSTAAAQRQTSNTYWRCWGVRTFSGRRVQHKASHSNAPREQQKPEQRGAGTDSCLGEQEEFPSQKSGCSSLVQEPHSVIADPVSSFIRCHKKLCASAYCDLWLARLQATAGLSRHSRTRP